MRKFFRPPPATRLSRALDRLQGGLTGTGSLEDVLNDLERAIADFSAMMPSAAEITTVQTRAERLRQLTAARLAGFRQGMEILAELEKRPVATVTYSANGSAGTVREPTAGADRRR